MEKVTGEIKGVDALENAARVARETRFATSSGMGSVTKVKTAHSSMSRVPKHIQLLQRRRVGVRRAVHHQKIENPKGRWQRSLAHTSNRERRGDKCFYKHEKVAAPTNESKRTNSPAPKKKASAKAAPCIT